MSDYPQEHPKSTPAVTRPEFPEERGQDRDGDWVPVAKENPRPLIPEGVYEAMCVKQRKKYNALFKREILALSFQIYLGPFAGKVVERFYPVSKVVGRNSGFYQEWTIANSGNAPRRGDRLSARKFHGKVFKVSVKTVSKNWNGRPRPQALQYSKADAILELAVTNERTQ